MYRLYKQLQKDSDLLATLAKKYNLVYNSLDPSQSISSASQLSTTLKPSIKVTSSEPTRLKGPVLLSITALGAALVATAIAESDTTAGASLREYQRVIVSLGNSAVNATSQLADLIAEETWMLAAAIEETFSQSEEGSGDTLAAVVEAESSAAIDYNSTATTALVLPIAEPIHVDDERPNFNLTETEAVHSTPTPPDDANAVVEPAEVLPFVSPSIVSSLHEHSSSPLTSSPETLPTSITESDYIALNEASATIPKPKDERMEVFVNAEYDVSTTVDAVEVMDKGVLAEEAVEVGRSDVEPPVVHSISFQAPLTKTPFALQRSVDPIDASAVSSPSTPLHTDTASVREAPVITLEQKPTKKATAAKRSKTSKATLLTTETPSQIDATMADHVNVTADALHTNNNTATKSVTPKRATKKTKKATSDDGQETTAASLESLATPTITPITSNTPAIDSVTFSVETTASVAVSDSSLTTTPTATPVPAPINPNATDAAKQTVKPKRKPALTLEKPIKPPVKASTSASVSLKKTKETITLETNTDIPSNKSTSKRKTKAI